MEAGEATHLGGRRVHTLEAGEATHLGSAPSTYSCLSLIIAISGLVWEFTAICHVRPMERERK